MNSAIELIANVHSIRVSVGSSQLLSLVSESLLSVAKKRGLVVLAWQPSMQLHGPRLGIGERSIAAITFSSMPVANQRVTVSLGTSATASTKRNSSP